MFNLSAGFNCAFPHKWHMHQIYVCSNVKAFVTVLNGTFESANLLN